MASVRMAISAGFYIAKLDGTQGSASEGPKDDKKRCWKFKKGECRFGDKCKFVHDEEPTANVVKSEEEKPDIMSLLKDEGTMQVIAEELLKKLACAAVRENTCPPKKRGDVRECGT